MFRLISLERSSSIPPWGILGSIGSGCQRAALEAIGSAKDGGLLLLGCLLLEIFLLEALVEALDGVRTYVDEILLDGLLQKGLGLEGGLGI